MSEKWGRIPGLTTFFVLMFDLEGMMNFSLNERRWSFVSSDCAYDSVFASAGKTCLVVCCSSGMIEPILARLCLSE